MAANAFLRLLERLNETIDRLFCFELEADELAWLTASGPGTSRPHKAAESIAG
jgi:hypothetical protein